PAAPAANARNSANRLATLHAVKLDQGAVRKMNRTWSVCTNRIARIMAGAFLTTLTAAAFAGTAAAQDDNSDKPKEIHFDLVTIPSVANCLRANHREEPRARATVVRGKQTDTLFLDLDGVRSDVNFTVFTLQRTVANPDASIIQPFPGFGLAAYQGD